MCACACEVKSESECVYNISAYDCEGQHECKGVCECDGGMSVTVGLSLKMMMV